MRLAGGVGFDAFLRRLVKWDVRLDKGVEGGKGGKEGVKRPNLGSGH